ncbi:inosine-uridine preferring nucleoside hydrolase-like isoform X2 [Haliotis rufescens]|nr:inosine-uridine preferring nucleoside hydrolase-like isoform X2 [Haliotis rufescens]XP_048258183.1 inosine-uridine preferring nucleoside hydrolase-like isoform X2 [Haliotis rufescens]XP_048258184.1 inosine-uridine preferring nucleoside hydrolase-like isoform X2 [Haliotis rufescens]
MGRKVILDVDTGIDDAAAIILAMSHSDVEVLGVTCVSGNIHIDKVLRNTFRVLKVCDRLNVPVFRGADSPILSHNREPVCFHGNDGLGDCDWDEEIDTSLVQSEHAVNALIRLVNKFPGEITFVPLGPLTNIALALKMDPEFGKKVKDVFVMGGNYKGIGNVTMSGEFNFHSDPEAAFISLHGLRDVTVVPWETCMDADLPWATYDRWMKVETPKSRFVERVTSFWVVKRDFRYIRKGIRLCDLNAMAACINEAAILEKQKVYATIELCGTVTRGQMAVDWRSHSDETANVTVITKICTESVARMFEEALNG